MAGQTVRTDTILKKMEDLFGQRMYSFEEMKKHYHRGNMKMVDYLEGHCTGEKFAIWLVLSALKLEDTDLYKKNEESFESDWLTEQLKSKIELNDEQHEQFKNY